LEFSLKKGTDIDDKILIKIAKPHLRFKCDPPHGGHHFKAFGAVIEKTTMLIFNKFSEKTKLSQKLCKNKAPRQCSGHSTRKNLLILEKMKWLATSEP